MTKFCTVIFALLFAASVHAQTASPNCTRIVAGSGTIVFNGATYTVNAAGSVLKGGVSVVGGQGSPLVLVSGELQVLGLDKKWWRLNGTGTSWAWTGAADPCPTAVVPPVLVPPSPLESKLTWTQGGASLAEINALVYTLYVDGSLIGIPVLGVVCTAPVAGDATPLSEFPCSGSFPSSTPGPHALVVTATNKTGESPKSNVLQYDLKPIPLTPTAVRSSPRK